MTSERLGEYVRSEGYLQVHETDHDPDEYDTDLDDCLDAIDDALTLWTDDPVPRDWRERQAKTQYEELYR